MLEKALLPKDVIALGVEGIRKIWHDKKMRGRGVIEDRAKTLIEAVHNSVGLDRGIGTKPEMDSWKSFHIQKTLVCKYM